MIDKVIALTADDPWGAMTKETATKILSDARAGVRGQPDKRICVCGHAAIGHTDYAPVDSATHNSLRETGTKACTPGRGYCECDNFREVATVSDVRLFRHSTRSSNEGHALRLGAVSAAEKNKVVKWSTTLKCYFCPEDEGYMRDGVVLIPLALDRYGREVHRATKYNAMSCAKHRTALAEASARREVDFGA
ncbi:hypothetical protein QEH42_gp185 [Microbacterium phage Pumpernickel]|uniref:Uncharacterized protein n=1 Tax=Microbacterium phage Pumpernickel TaxID=2885983 RepID=A0AAE8Y8J4_9CAUD|nr:hypothetical protein QEH42_gp185 [Microbacterium phage Pumpernickel]UDL16033.1 hypothetical protein SEA_PUMPERNICKEL_283 [Microbacterium phage Pumpernickel]